MRRLILVVALAGCAGSQTNTARPQTAECPPPTEAGRESLSELGPRVRFARSGPQAPLVVTFLNVGQGDCIHIACPNGNDIVVDCGSKADGDRQATAAALRSLVDGGVETLVVTHGDEDHHNYLRNSLEGRDLGRVLLGGVADQYTGPVAENLTEWVERDASSWAYAEASEASQPGTPDTRFACGDTDVYVLAASEMTTSGSNGHKKNTPSIVLMLERNGFKVMLAGDATHETEGRILQRYGHGNLGFLDIDVLKVAHHGATTSTVPHNDHQGVSWLNTLSPAEVVISAGTHNGFGHPRCEVVQALDAAQGMSELAAPAEATCATGTGSDAWTTFQVAHAVWSTWDDGHLQLTVDVSGHGAMAPVEFQ